MILKSNSTTYAGEIKYASIPELSKVKIFFFAIVEINVPGDTLDYLQVPKKSLILIFSSTSHWHKSDANDN